LFPSPLGQPLLAALPPTLLRAAREFRLRRVTLFVPARPRHLHPAAIDREHQPLADLPHGSQRRPHLLAIGGHEALQQAVRPTLEQLHEGLIADLGYLLLFEQPPDNLQRLPEALAQLGVIAPRPEERRKHQRPRRPTTIATKLDALEAAGRRQPLKHLVQIGGVRLRRPFPHGVLM
jgi:hypothetical protein